VPKHSRRRDDDDFDNPPWPAERAHPDTTPDDDLEGVDEPAWSTFNADGVVHGPEPRPAWVITSPAATDTDLGVFKTGKEADVSLIRRASADAESLLAAKRYRDTDHRMFHRDAAYLEGRKEKKSRERRAMATRTSFGKQLIAGRWAAAEFEMLARLWSAGAAVPYPVQLLGTEVLMEFVGAPDGTAAPRLAQIRPAPEDAADLFAQVRDVLSVLARAGFAHGDLSAYNVLVDDGRIVLIDLPQAVDLVGNPRAEEFLRRDCVNICTWFVARGVDADADRLVRDLLRESR
jgi:RIO kinase 1